MKQHSVQLNLHWSVLWNIEQITYISCSNGEERSTHKGDVIPWIEAMPDGGQHVSE